MWIRWENIVGRGVVWMGHGVLMGILFREPVLLARLTKKSRLFWLPSGQKNLRVLMLNALSFIFCLFHSFVWQWRYNLITFTNRLNYIYKEVMFFCICASQFSYLLGCPQSQPHTISSRLLGPKGSYGPKWKAVYVWGHPCFSHWWLQQKGCCSFYNAHKKTTEPSMKMFSGNSPCIVVDTKGISIKTFFFLPT